MKSQTLAMVVALAMSLVAANQLQARPRVLSASIPFQFEVGGVRLPAGEYEIESVTTGNGTIERIHEANGKAAARFSTIAGEPREANATPQLVFHRYGSSYFLSQIRTGDGHALDLPQSKREEEAARAQRSTSGQAVSVALAVR